MINASEALRRSTSIILEKNDNQLKNIENSINKAVSNGEQKCFIYEYPSETVRNHLVSLGYKIGGNDGRYNETCIKISWDGV